MAVKKTTIPQVSEKTLRIESYLSKCKIGQELSFDAIEHKTGVKMDLKGKAYLRTALKRRKLEYSAIKGYGIKLADPGSTMPIIVKRLDKINSTVKKAEKTQKNLQEQFFENLSQNEQKQLLFIGAAFGAIKVAAENGKILYQSKNKINNTMAIPIPKYD